MRFGKLFAGGGVSGFWRFEELYEELDFVTDSPQRRESWEFGSLASTNGLYEFGSLASTNDLWKFVTSTVRVNNQKNVGPSWKEFFLIITN